MKMHFRLAGFLWLMLLGAFIAGCRLPDDDIPPAVSVMKPAYGSYFQVGDTIEVEASYSDDQKLDYVQVTLVDAENRPLLPPLEMKPGKTSFTLRGDYILTAPLPESGTYHLRFRAGDGSNTRNEFIRIYISSTPRRLLYPLIITRQAAGKSKVYRLTENKNWSVIYSFADNYIASAIGNSWSQLYLCTAFPGGLSAIQLPQGNQIWHVSTQQSIGGNYMQAISSNDPLLYVAYREKGIRTYDHTGSELYAAETVESAYPQAVTSTNNYIAAAFRDKFNGLNYLALFHKTGGKLLQYKFMEMETLAIFDTGNDNLILAGNFGGSGLVHYYNQTDNSLAPLKKLPAEAFTVAAQLNKNAYVLATKSMLYSYRTDRNSLLPLLKLAGATALACDAASNRIYVTQGLMMNSIDFQSGNILDRVNLPDTARALHLVYSK